MNNLDDRTYKLLFAVRRSVRYHDRRRRFYEIWNTITVAGATIGGSSAVAAIMADSTAVSAAFSAAVAVLGAIDLAVGTARCADRHGDLARQFISLERMFAHGRDLDDDEYPELVRRRLEIEASEPTTLRLLDAMCHYEILRSIGDAKRHPRVPWLRRAASQFFSQTDYALSLAETVGEGA